MSGAFDEVQQVSLGILEEKHLPATARRLRRLFELNTSGCEVLAG